MPPLTVDSACALPASEVGAALLLAPEDQWFERKSARVNPKALGDTLIGFANADGGVVAIGLSDGAVEGTDALGRKRNDLMQAAIDFSTPPIRAHSRLMECRNSAGAADHLLLFDVAPAEGVVYANQRDEVFLRVGDENRRLTFAQRQELAFDRGSESYEARTLPDTSLGIVHPKLLRDYVTAAGASSGGRLMQVRGLMKDDLLTIAGYLLFAEHPQTQLPEALVRVLSYRGRERGSGARQSLVADERFEGPIPIMLENARGLIKRLQPRRRALAGSGRFENIALVPEDAWLEGLVNAVVHRSYSLAGDHIRVEIFDDRIEISSPGRFPGIVDLTDPLDAPRFARNPRIARVCADLALGQELGEGIRRIYEEMRLAGLSDPVYTQTSASVRLLLSAEPRDRELDAQLTPDARTVAVALRNAGRLSTGEVAELLDRSRPYAIRVLKALERAETIRWIGKAPQDPRAYWELVR